MKKLIRLPFLMALWMPLLMMGVFVYSPASSAGKKDDMRLTDFLPAPASKGEYLEFEKMIEANLGKVEEFRFIKQWADKKGLPIYLFGGAATAFAVYSKWEKKYQEGVREYAPDKFDFKLTNIFHFNQDIDLLLDGSEEEIIELQKELDTNFPYQKTTGGKTISVWEVRAFRHTINYKPYIIDNQDFENQNTDSNSAGLIKITDPKPNRSRVQDLRSTRTGEGQFFKDIVNGQITYYHTGYHQKTSRSDLANPIAISAIRFLIKLFEYNLTTDAKSMATVESILKDADFNKINGVRGSMRWMQKNAAKLLDNAVDVESAWRYLKKIGLLKGLSVFGTEQDPSSVAWAMAQKPLPSFTVGQAGPDTAEKRGIDTAYFRIDHFKDYERIRMGKLDAPNLFAVKDKVKMSLKSEQKPGEVWVSFRVHPESAVGKDILLKEGSDSIQILNRKSLTVVPETLKIPRESFIHFIARNADPDYVAYIIRQYNLLSTLDEAEYVALKKFLSNQRYTEKKQMYAHLLLPLIMKYEHRQAYSSPDRFINYIKRLLEEEEITKADVAQLVLSHVDDFFSMNPSYNQAIQLKTLIRHGPQFVTYMTLLMKKYVVTSKDYIQLLEFGEKPTDKYRRRMSYFVENSFEKFLALEPTPRQIAFVLDHLEPQTKISVIEKHEKFLKSKIRNCDDILADASTQVSRMSRVFEY